LTGLIEVPIVKRIRPWTVSTLPDNWQQLRDRWVSFHLIRVLGGFAGLALLVAGAIFTNA
jgi:CHASE1-domain containing sensor protein